MSGRKLPGLTPWQEQLVAELRKVAALRSDHLRVLTKPKVNQKDRIATVRIRLCTKGITLTESGLALQGSEEFILRIGPHPFSPPVAEVDHLRFLGWPHVLQGQRICIYLDPSREWQPSLGITGLLDRLWHWLEDAAGGRFDTAAAMYHAVGGVLHHSEGTPTVVVRESYPAQRHTIARIVSRSAHRLDITYSADTDGLRVPVLMLETQLPLGATSSLAALLMLLDDPYMDQLANRTPRVSGQSSAFLTSLAACAIRNPNGTEQYFILAVPHPRGGAPHLLCGRLPGRSADSLRRTARRNGPARHPEPSEVSRAISIEWCAVSDERAEVTTRRDTSSPVNGFLGKSVHIWGCGGLGSWIAEFIARAGAKHITICDPGTVTGGLLVRQNYVEDDIGSSKVNALAARLASIRDDLVVTPSPGGIPDDPASLLDADLIVDATVSNVITQYLDSYSHAPNRRALIAQVATDARSGTLGITNICAAGSATPSALDSSAGVHVLEDSELELYQRLWQEPLRGDELVPTRGCSVPTFHGSAADLAAIAAILTTIIGSHLQSAAASSGTHLVSLPHADSGPRHYYHPAEID